MINPNGEGSNNPSGGSMNPGGQPVSDSNAGNAPTSMGGATGDANTGSGTGTTGGTGSGYGGRLQNVTERVSSAASGAWRQTVQGAGTARERTEFYLRENPVPTVIGALAIGLAIGLAIRYSSEESRKEEKQVSTPLGDLNLGALSLPFLWPFFKNVQRRYEDTADVVKESVRDIDVDRYVKPLRKKWRNWTN